MKRLKDSKTEVSIKKDFGRRLKEIRMQKKLTQSQLAELAEIDAKHISHIETGRSFPKADLIEKLAVSLGVCYNEFFNTKHYKKRQDIITDISGILQNADDTKLEKIYKLLLDILF